MDIVKSPSELQKIVERIRPTKRIGFVPTMGALHKGHISLIESARRETEFVIVSIFVNPLQFGPSEDFDEYPRPYEKDIEIAEGLGVDILFSPDVKDIYPIKQTVFVSLPELENLLCGAKREGHFRGVLTVVAKLFNITKPHFAYFGQKDYQQALIIKRMVEELNFDIAIKVLPTVREEDGLAVSSRNLYLSDEERKRACVLYSALKKAEDLILNQRGVSEAIDSAKRMIEKNGLSVEYFAICDPETLRPIDRFQDRALIAVAAKMDATRLIDNILVNYEL
jgi:pantoate--beta-alanine ligase